ncbi:MAG: hypothetical protein CME30_02365 [Gemmatimonadetes bacterium]|nr:hypothetical protein [Gemmatimonadota bacterium]
MLADVDRIYVAKGRKVVDFALTDDALDESELLKLLLGRSGKLRAPAIRVDRSLLVGYNQEMFTSVLL